MTPVPHASLYTEKRDSANNMMGSGCLPPTRLKTVPFFTAPFKINSYTAITIKDCRA